MNRRRDRRWATLGLSLAAIAGLGMALSWWPGKGVHVPNSYSSPAEQRSETGVRHDHVVAELFQQGVAMLHTRRYDLASVSLHKLLQIAPRMPEAHVNMGFAQLGLARYAIAEDFFHTALELRATQVNAYYGLAMALEARKDLAGARGAMQTYIHLSGQEDPYRRKAQSAIWEWSEAGRDASKAVTGRVAAVEPVKEGLGNERP